MTERLFNPRAGHKQRSKHEIKAIKTSVQSLNEETDPSVVQDVFNSMRTQDFRKFRSKFNTISDIIGGRRRGGYQTAHISLRIEELLTNEGIPVGRADTHTGVIRFVLKKDLNKSREVLRAFVVNPSGIQRPSV